MRPATMIGTEDRILNPWAQFVKKYGFLPLIGGGTTKYVLNLCAILFFIATCNMDTISFPNYDFTADSSPYMLLMLLLQSLQL